MTAWQWVGAIVAVSPLLVGAVALLRDDEGRWAVLLIACLAVWITAILMAVGCIPPTGVC